MVSIFDADLVKDHFIITDNGRRALIDTGCPFIINDENKQSKPMGELYLNDARRNVDPTIDEFRGLEYFAQRKVLFDYRKAVVVIADQGDEVDPVHPVAEFPISGLPIRIVFSVVIDGVSHKLIFDTGASIANYLTESIAKTGTSCGTVEDFHPQKGKYTVNLFSLPVEVGGETVDIPFGVQPADIDRDVQMSGAVGVIGVGLYKNFQVLVDLPNKRLVLGRY
ncbi:hypothetical protein SAMN05720761_12057 [Fibrobacter sp. UWCM]|uniref:hypothetical protein n=1 Tax=Fibrobacter sp. UWCM TaxID=1896208 RepID=UPI00091801B6|nr:hypothetical protein [Fibrobacter sp. UWCM]SHH64231.1 hypothetical protein SAMN05720761_12057 [Fibrobacter sp. UWCM]